MARVHRLRLLLNFLRTSERREEESYKKKVVNEEKFH